MRSPHRVPPSLPASAISLLLLAVFPSHSPAAVPALDYLHPAGAQAGARVTVRTGASWDSSNVQWLASSPRLTFEPATDKGAFVVQVAPDAPPGPCLIRAANEDGASEPRIFVVGTFSEVGEIEPNDNGGQPQLLESLPVVVNGALEKNGDVDAFSVPLQAGQWLVASVDAYALDSPMDPMLHLLDSRGAKAAFHHDHITLDPRLVFQAPEDGRYTVLLAAFAHPPRADVRFTGGKDTVYRLTLSNGPWPNYAFPAAVRRGAAASVELHGWNLDNPGGVRTAQVDTAPLGPDTDWVTVPCPGGPGPWRLELGSDPELMESPDANSHDPNAPMTVQPPCAIHGRIETPGDQDRFQFQAARGDRFQFGVTSASLGSPLDAILRVDNADGKELAKNDDGGSGVDPSLAWTAPEDGTFTVVLGDLLRLGGPEYVYRLHIGRPAPDVEVTVDGSAFTVEPGQSLELKLAVTRLHGHTNALEVAATDLPAGLSADPASVPAKGGAVTLKLTAAPDAPPGRTTLRVIARQVDAANLAWERDAVAPLKPKNADRDHLLVRSADRILLTVKAKPAAADPPKPES